MLPIEGPNWHAKMATTLQAVYLNCGRHVRCRAHARHRYGAACPGRAFTPLRERGVPRRGTDIAGLCPGRLAACARSHLFTCERDWCRDPSGHGRSKIVWGMESGFVTGCCDLIMNGVLAGESDEAPVGTGVLSQIPATGASSWVSLSFVLPSPHRQRRSCLSRSRMCAVTC